MSWQFGRVGITYSLRCNASCSFCAVKSGPENKERMSLGTAIRCIHQVAENSFFKEIKITGGEPFLFYQNLATLIEEVQKAGLNSSVITNGFWAETEEIALRKLECLVKKGLKEINYSADAYHQKFIPIERLRNAFRATKSVGLSIIIYYVEGAHSEPCSAFLKKLDLPIQRVKLINADETYKISKLEGDLQTLTFGDQIIVRKTFITPAGRGKDCRSDLLLFPLKEFSEVPCPEIGRSYMIMPNLSVFACCSGYLPHRLRVGKLSRESFAKAVERSDGDILLRVLRERGVLFLYRKVRERGLFLGSRSYAGMCHLCNDLLNRVPRRHLEEISFKALFSNRR